MLDSLVRVSQTATTKGSKNIVFRSVAVWEPGTGGQDVGNTKFEEYFSTRRDGHSAELAGATTNSDGKRRTVGYRRRYDV